MIRIINADVIDGLRSLPEKSVHCVITSPPYDNLRKYGEYTWDFKKTALELFRVLVDGGVICWNVGDATINGSETLTGARQAIYFVDRVGFNLHDTMIWEKTNCTNPERVRYTQLFEFIYILSKGKPRAFNPIFDKKNTYAGTSCFGENTFRKPDGTMGKRSKPIIKDFGMRGNVWKGNTRGQEEVCKEQDHPGMMPKWLARDLIRSWSNPNDLILDPFAGSGTTGVEARDLNRDAVLIEINPAYVEIARRKLRADEQLFDDTVQVITA